MNVRTITRSGSLATLTALILGLAFGAIAVAEEDLPLNLQAVAVNVGARGPRGQTRIDIRVTRWTTEEERAVVLEALKDPTSRSLPNALQAQDSVGRLRQPQGLGHELRYSRLVPMEDGGMQIVLATDRPIAFVEASRSLRTLDNNVTLIHLTLDAEGNGEGQMMVGAEMVWDEEANRLTIEQVSSEPVRLNSVRLR